MTAGNQSEYYSSAQNSDNVSNETIQILALLHPNASVDIIRDKLNRLSPIGMDAFVDPSRFLQSLSQKNCHIVLAADAVPGLPAEELLGQRSRLCPDIPVILLTNAIGEERTVELLKQGAADIVLNSNLDRLPMAVSRAIKETHTEVHSRPDTPMKQTASNSAAQDAAEYSSSVQRLRHEIEQLREVQHIARLGSIDWDAASGRLTWSDGANHICGIENGSDTPPYSIAKTCTIAQERERIAVAWNRAIQQKSIFDETYWINTPSGIKKFVHCLLLPKVDGSGYLTAMSGALQDITGLQLSDHGFSRVKPNDRLMLDSICDGAVMFDKDGMILNINEKFAKGFGKTVQEVIGTNVRDYHPKEIYGDLGERVICRIKQVFDTGAKTIYRDFSRETCYKSRYYPVIDNHQVIAVSVLATDMASRRQAEEETVRRMESEARLKVMTEFFTNASHELNTPLTLILLQIDMMRDYISDPEMMQSLISNISQNSYRLTRLVGNLLDITRIDAGFLKLNFARKDIVAILADICRWVEAYAKARGIYLGFTYNVVSKFMDVDSDKIERIMLNLLSNAIKHTPEGGCILVDFKDKKDKVIISVKDTGIGIPEDKINYIFDRFMQVENTLIRSTQGCGIGLSLVKSLTEMHAGVVYATSKLGAGSTFTIELPVSNQNTEDQVTVLEGFELNKKVKMEMSDLYIEVEESD